MKITSWNVNSVKARLPRLLAYLETVKPDVVCLQELKCVDEGFPAESIAQAGYKFVTHGQKTYNGVAILSKNNLENVSRGFSDGGDDSASRLIGADVAPGVRVYSAYVPNGQSVGSDKYVYKLEWLKRLKAYLERTHQPSEKLVLVGDFNVAPEDRDVHDPKAWEGQVLCSEPERRALQEVRAFGFEDTFRRFHEEGGRFSWWDYRMLAFPKNRGLRIDFVWATPPAAKLCSAADIARDERKGAQPSDHAPVWADFAF